MRTTKRRRGAVVDMGFTLVELLIVIVVLGILSGIVVFGVGQFRGDAQNAACKADLATISIAADAFSARDPAAAYPTSVAQLVTGGYLKAAPATGAYTFNATTKTVTRTPSCDPAPTPTPVGANQITNPSFDDDGSTQTPSGWSTWGDADADYTEADDSRDGSLAGTHWRPFGSYSVYTYQVKSVPNGLYTVKAWLKTTGAGITSRLEVKDHGGAQINLPIVSSTWTQLVRQDINVTNGQATIGVYSEGPAGTWVNFDDVEFFRQ